MPGILPVRLSLLGLLGGPSLEINLQYSLEGMVVASDAVVCARMIDVVETRDKSGNLMNSSLLLVTYGVKGAAEGDTLCFSWWGKAAERPASEGLFFLRRTMQAYGRDGQSCDTWPVDLPEGPAIRWLDLEGEMAMLTGHGFRLLKTEQEIVHACRRTAEAEERYREQNWGEAPTIGYLEIPPETQAWNELWSGSACFLLVPEFMFRAAKPSLQD
jgi:hypothetical protein